MGNISGLRFGSYYHIYNRGNNFEKIFFEDRNYPYFLSLYEEHIVPIVDAFAYCLLPNHFHFLIRVKNELEVSSIKKLEPSRCFSNFFNSYTKSINKAYGRVGSLFQKPFRRIEIASEDYFRQLVLYIHLNPEKHGHAIDFRRYPYSSYNCLIGNGPTFLNTELILKWFGSQEAFLNAHSSYKANKNLEWLYAED